MQGEEFISDCITPDAGTADIAAMGRGEPGLPAGFTWRQKHYSIERLLETWKTNNDGQGGGDANKYLRRHWFRVQTTSGETMTLYCLRQAPAGQKKHRRWWLYSMAPGEKAN